MYGSPPSAGMVVAVVTGVMRMMIVPAVDVDKLRVRSGRERAAAGGVEAHDAGDGAGVVAGEGAGGDDGDVDDDDPPHAEGERGDGEGAQEEEHGGADERAEGGLGAQDALELVLRRAEEEKLVLAVPGDEELLFFFDRGGCDGGVGGSDACFGRRWHRRRVVVSLLDISIRDGSAVGARTPRQGVVGQAKPDGSLRRPLAVVPDDP
ncbi:hypothetical protein VTK73DRAFT_1736 [Phialemonium thermophilum]|uniref:Uncharacterized protein n=1 Tax=Phialemonium thermophilum TaxID=223376 RepID=A0ABR3VT18_9PEZI